MAVKFNSSGGGSVTLDAPSTASNLTVTLPSASGTLATTDGGNTTFTSITDSGNLTFTGTGNRITGDFSNGTAANRVMFQTSTANAGTFFGVVANGTPTDAYGTGFVAFANGDTASSHTASLYAFKNNDTRITSGSNTGTYYPMTFYTGGSERMRIDTSGNAGIGVTPLSSVKLQVKGSGNTSASYAALFTDSGGNNLLYARNDGAMGFGVSGTAMALDVYSNLALSSATTANCFISFANSADGGTQGYVGDSKAICSTGANSFIGVRGESGIIFGVGNTENMRLQTGGTLILKGGSTSATGTGITFPATQSASTDANTLDDYEEGTFTPTITASGGGSVGSYSWQAGDYVKIGGWVYFQIYINYTKGTLSGNLNVANLPFTTKNNNAHYNTITCGYWNGLTTSIVNIYAYIDPNTTNFSIRKNTAASTNTNGYMTASDLAAGNVEIMYSGFYPVA